MISGFLGISCGKLRIKDKGLAGGIYQGVRNRREIQLTRFALPFDYTCFADGYYI